MHTRGSRAFKNNFFSGDHGKVASDIFMDSIAELGPGAALDGALAEACVSQFAYASGGGDLDFVAFVVELVLDKLLNPVVIGANNLLWGQKEVEVLSVVLI